MMNRHSLDPYPIPKDRLPMYINEPWLIDKTLLDLQPKSEPDDKDDNIRIYIPMDLNRDAILRRLDGIINHYGEANEENEYAFSTEVDALVAQIEIYDQIWYVRHMPSKGEHSLEAIALVKEFVSRLQEIPDGCAECFPFELIEELEGEFLTECE